ncbi:MAG: MoaD/ThiS family protein [Polyangiaceae bacterium]|nr:MoaD/ThiS family protein [Polyangiaceae bacterium]
MRVTVELTYEMTKEVGVERFDVDDVSTVAELVERAKERVGPSFDKHVRLAAVAVNGVLVHYKRGMRTKLADGDIVNFVKASAGG